MSTFSQHSSFEFEYTPHLWVTHKAHHLACCRVTQLLDVRVLATAQPPSTSQVTSGACMNQQQQSQADTVACVVLFDSTFCCCTFSVHPGLPVQQGCDWLPIFQHAQQMFGTKRCCATAAGEAGGCTTQTYLFPCQHLLTARTRAVQGS
jgi:hypothetical protein